MFQYDGVSGLLFDRFSERHHFLDTHQVGCNQRHHRVAAHHFHGDYSLVAVFIAGNERE